jgi:hypothetical protein
LLYDATSAGAQSYFELAKEILNNQVKNPIYPQSSTTF